MEQGSNLINRTFYIILLNRQIVSTDQVTGYEIIKNHLNSINEVHIHIASKQAIVVDTF